MSAIYNKTLELFSASENEQFSLNEEIIRLIKESMNTKQDNFLTQALQKAQNNNDTNSWNYIQQNIIQCVNTFEYQKNGTDYVSYLVLLPLMFIPNANSIHLPSLQEMESWWFQALSSNLLISPNAEQFNLAPVLLGKNNASTMTMTDWYQIHKANSLNLDKRVNRAMYANSFKIQAVADQPNLSFLVATINMEKNNLSHIPLLALTDDDALQEVIDLMGYNLNSQIPDAKWLCMPVGTVTDIISHAFDTFQDLLISNMIIKHYPNPAVKFALLPTEPHHCFTLIVWNERKNLVLDATILNQYIKDHNELTQSITDYLEHYSVSSLYVGDTAISEDKLQELGKIDFAHYLRKNGASVINLE